MRFIAAEDIPVLLGELAAAGSKVWAPQVIRDTVNTVLFTSWRPPDEISYDARTSISAKELLLPATEVLFSYRYESDGSREQARIDPPESREGKQVLFGARVCDARAIDALDALFAAGAGGYQDPSYRQRRESLAVITLACTSGDEACFCSSFAKGSADTAGSDLFLYPVEGGFLAEAVTAAGAAIAAAGLFAESSLEAPQLAQTAVIDAAALQGRLQVLFSDMAFWERAAERCLSCGYCSHACPACHCFNIFDEMRSDRQGERLRAWDSCMFHSYTQETSGHNPRPTPAHRLRNRINHKFSYYPAHHGKMLCTGCGRCIRGCPAGIDLRDILRQAALPQAAGSSPGEETR